MYRVMHGMIMLFEK